MTRSISAVSALIAVAMTTQIACGAGMRAPLATPASAPAPYPALYPGPAPPPPPMPAAKAEGDTELVSEEVSASESKEIAGAPSRGAVHAQDRRVAEAAPMMQPTSPGPAAPAVPPSAAPRRPEASPVASDAAHDVSLIIYSAHVTMSVYQVDASLDAVEQIARELGGYLATRADQEITIRVPRARFDEAVHRIEQSGDVVHRDVSAEDVTDQFVDLEIRLRNARAMRDRLQLLLAKADVKEALEIEKELGRVTGEIERIEGKLKLLRDKIAYSTITVTFEGRGAGTLQTPPHRLPFSWLREMGLPNLLNLNN
jgi:hypothetical protein